MESTNNSFWIFLQKNLTLKHTRVARYSEFAENLAIYEVVENGNSIV